MKVYIPWECPQSYVTALTALGAEPRFSLPEDGAGLLLPGGWDLDPRLYGQENRGSEGIDGERDAAELRAVERFLSLGRPILGICRGAQLLNVAFGGTLIQHMENHDRIHGEDRYHATRTEDPLLRELYGETFVVNSSHHQAADRLGNGLRAVQWAEDGVVEALRHETLPVFAVQWHPERLRTPTDGWRLLERWLREL